MTDRKVGRPPVGPPIHVRLDPELVQWLDRRAGELEQPRAQLIRDILDAVRRADLATLAAHYLDMPAGQMTIDELVR